MKSLIFALAILVTSFATQAHTITKVECSDKSGRLKVTGEYFDYSNSNVYSVVLTIKNPNGSTKWQSQKILIKSNGTFSVDTVPYYTVGQTMYWVQYKNNNVTSWDGSFKATYRDHRGREQNLACGVMPITLTSWNATINKNDRSIVDLTWSVDMESNVAYYLLEASTDGGRTWDSIKRVDSKVGGNTTSKTDYAYAFTNPKVDVIKKDVAKTSHNGLGALGLTLAIGVIAVSMRSKGMAGIACVLILATVACKKSVDAPAQTYKYNAFRLSNVDNDGSSKTFETRTVRY